MQYVRNNSRPGYINSNVSNCNMHISYRKDNSLNRRCLLSKFPSAVFHSLALCKNNTNEAHQKLNGWIVWTLQLSDFICLSEVEKEARVMGGRECDGLATPVEMSQRKNTKHRDGFM